MICYIPLTNGQLCEKLSHAITPWYHPDDVTRLSVIKVTWFLPTSRMNFNHMHEGIDTKVWHKLQQYVYFPLQWRHNERNGVSNDRHIDCLLNRLFRRRSKKTSKLRVIGLCEGDSPVRLVTWNAFPCHDVPGKEKHDDVIKWKHFPHYWPFVRGIHQWPVDFLHKGSVMRSDVSFDVSLCKQPNKQLRGRWIKMSWALIQYKDVILPV